MEKIENAAEFVELSGYTNGTHYYDLIQKYEGKNFESDCEVGEFIVELTNLLHDDELDPLDKIILAKWLTSEAQMNYIKLG